MNPTDTPSLSVPLSRTSAAHADTTTGRDVFQKPRFGTIIRHIFRSRDMRRALPSLALSSFTSNLLALALPLAILQLFDRVIVNRSFETLILLLAGVIVALTLEEILRLLNARVTGWLGARYEHAQTSSALDKVLHAPLGLLQRDEPGVHVDRLLSTAKVSSFYSGQALLVLFDLPFILLFLGVIWFIGGPLIVVPVTLLLLFTLIALIAGRRLRVQHQQRRAMDDRRHNFLNETLRSLFSVKMLGMERLMQRRYERLQEGNVNHGAEVTYGSAKASSLGQFFTQIMIISIISFGGFVVFAGNMTPGGLAACMMLSVRALQPLRRSLAVWLRYQSFVDAQQRLDEVMNLPAESTAKRPPLPPVRQSITLQDVALVRAPQGKDHIFQGLNLHVPAGACIAVRGASGSGKSALLSLINGITKPDAGTVLVDGRPLAEFDPESAAREIALLPQQGSLVAGTLMENMTLFNPALEGAALKLSQRLGLDRAVAGMKLGYDTLVEDSNALSLPVGVSQRVAVIRALIHDPSVILFDESNIALDLQGDRHLRDMLAEEKRRRTIILVTHRPSLLSLADQTYTLKDGRLVKDHQETGQKPDPAEEASRCLASPASRMKPGAGDFLDLGPYFAEESDLSRCLQPLLRAMNWHGSDRELAESLPHMSRSLDITGLRSIMANLGYKDVRFRERLSRLDDRLLPCLFVPAGQPARVILGRQEDGRLRVFDSQRNVEALLAPSRQQGDVYVFQPQEAETPGEGPARGWVRTLAGRFKWHIALTFVITVFATTLSLAPPLFVMAMYNRVLPTGDIRMGLYLLAGVGIAVFLGWFLQRLKLRMISFMAGRAEYIIGNAAFQRILDLPVNASQGPSPPRQAMRLRSFENLREFFIGPLATLTFELPATLILLAAIAFLNPWALPVIGVSALLFLFLGLAARGPQRNRMQESAKWAGKRWEFLMETVSSLRPLRSVGAGAFWLNRFRELSGRSALASFRANWLNAEMASAARLIGMLTGVVVLGVSVVGVMNDWMSTGAVIATMIIVWRLTGPMQNALMAATTLSRVSSTMRQLDSLMRLPVEDNGLARRTRRPPAQGAVNFTRVSFRYSNDAEPALLGVTFSVTPGRMATIAGANGAGKSTLLKLITRAYTPQAGMIRLDNVDLRQIPVADLRAQISYMPQHCDIFYGTVEQNLRLANPTATSEELCWALHMAGLFADVEALPEGLGTRISNNQAEQLPNGFRQRLSLARTMLKPAPIVLMDEPGNGMDDQGDLAVVRCIEHLKGRSTLFLVSQRPSHMRLADAVIYLENGVIKKIGPFDQINEIVMAELNK